MSSYPSNYSLQNESPTKFLNVVVEIEGTDIKFAIVDTYKKIRFGDPDLDYGDPGIVWGGLRKLTGVYPYLSINSNLTISQRIEPEQGRASASTLSLEFVDVKGFMTKFVTPGQYVDEILGGKLVKIWVGYQNTSFKEDYYVIFRGYVSSVTCVPTKVIMQLTDANLKRRQQAFFTGKTQIRSISKTFNPGDISVSTITIPVHGFKNGMKVQFNSTGVFPPPIDTSEYWVDNVTTNTLQVSSTDTEVVSKNFAPADVILPDQIKITNHGFVDGTKITFTTTGTLPTPLGLLVDYFVVSSSQNTFMVASVENGTPIAFGGGGSGQHTVTTKPNIVQFTGTGSGVHTIYMIDIGKFSTTVPVYKTDGITQHILGPDLTYDSIVNTFIQVGDEFMSYGFSGIGVDSITVQRGQLGSLPEDHAIDDDVENPVQITGNVIDMSLKMMLSGENGQWKTGITISSFVQTNNPQLGNISNALILPDGINAVEEYGLAAGDYLYVSGSTSNDGTYTIKTFGAKAGYPNNVIYVNEVFTLEFPTVGTFGIRSQYDTFPVNFGNGLRPIDVDVAKWQNIKSLFASRPENTFQLLITEPGSPKDTIEKEFLLPNGFYSATRFGRISCAATTPPIAGENLVVLNGSNVKNPENISVVRTLNNRRFFNEVQYAYDYDTTGKDRSVTKTLDSESISKITISSVLPIKAKGMKTELGALDLVSRRGGYILRRYKDAAYEISLQTNWQAASLVQVTDVVALYDDGVLKIANLDTGERNIGAQLFEVIDWSLDIRSGQGSLKLLSSPGYQINDRFGVIAPSSQLDVGSTTSEIIIKDSYGAVYPGEEWRKWEPILGDEVQIRNGDWSIVYNTSIVALNPVNPYKMTVNPALPSAPPANSVMELAPYAVPNPLVNQKSKLLFQYIDPSLAVVTGISTTQFTVSPADALKISAGQPIMIHNNDYSIMSDEVKVDSIVGVTVTLTEAISFTPAVGQTAEFIGFTDLRGPYRIL